MPSLLSQGTQSALTCLTWADCPAGVAVPCRNVHPTTRLLQPFPGSAQLPPGVLMISSRSVQLCTCLGSTLQQQQHQQQAGWQQEQATSSSAAMQAAAAADPSAAVNGLCVVQHQLVQWALSGLPCSCVAFNPGQWLVGDARAGAW